MKYVAKGLLADPSRHVATRDLLALAAGVDVAKAEEARATLRRLETAQAETTKKDYDRIVDQYIRFARAREHDPWSADPEALPAWLYCSAKGHTKKGISQRLSVVRDRFIAKGLPDPLRHRLVAETLQALTSNAPVRRRTHEILLLDDFRELKRTLSTSSLGGLRMTVLLGFGFVLMLKQESINTMKTTDVSVGGGRLTVRSTYKGRPLLQSITSNEGDGLVEHVQDYLERAEIGEGPLFPAIERNRVVGTGPLVKSRLDRMYKERLILAGYDPTRYCWSSLRYGFLYWASRHNFDEADLCKRAGYDTLASLQKVLDEIVSGSGGYRIPGTDAREPAPVFDFVADASVTD